MGIYTPEGETTFGYLGAIEAAVRKKASTAAVWQAVRAEAARVGRTELGITFGDVRTIRSWAVKMRNADAAYAAANPADTIDASMTTTAIWSPNDYNTIATTPSFSVRGQVTIEKTDGTVVQQWMTWNFADNPYLYTVAGYTTRIADVFNSRAQTAPEKTATPNGTVTAVTGINIQVF